MFRHYLVTALRNLAVNKLQSAIAIGGLAIGIAAAILAGLIVANQASYDDFLPLHERLYLVTLEASLGGQPPIYVPLTPHDLAARLRQNFGALQAVARLDAGAEMLPDHYSLRHGNVEADEFIFSADPNIFDLLRLPVLYGHLENALVAPDSIVIPRRIAEKYFGRDDVVGETLELDRQHPLKITAVIADLPANATNLRTGIFMSGRASYSGLGRADRRPGNARTGDFSQDALTLVRLAPGASVTAIERRMFALRDSLLPRPAIVNVRPRLVALDALHLSPHYSPGIRDRLAILSAAAMLILFLAIANFVNLLTARAARRTIEVGIRKALGAGRGALIGQFLAEAVVQSAFALLIAAAAVELLLPLVNAFLNSGATFDYWRHPGLLLILLAGAIGIGVLAGFYPALFLSAFRPALVLKGLVSMPARADLVRGLLVTAQFAILLLLMIAAAVATEQYRFSIRESLRFDTDQTLFVRLSEKGHPAPDRVSLCTGAFQTAVAALPGVRATACSDTHFLDEMYSIWPITRAGLSHVVSVNMIGAGPGLLQFYDQKPVAGRGLRETDRIPILTDGGRVKRTAPINVLINAEAVRAFGFASPQAAVGQILYNKVGSPIPVLIVGVVPDFAMYSPEKKIEPVAYFYFMQDFIIHIKLAGHDIPETLAAIDAAWNRTGPQGPIQRTFVNSYVENLNLSLLRQGQAFTGFAGVAVLLGCLGLFGLAVSATLRRTKEIGIRKAMGASTADVTRLLLWQFAKPLLWANAIAWPVAWWLMRRWLAGFAYHVDLQIWPFAAATLLTLTVALLTVLGQVLIAARRRPVLALRYE
jgi:putative ABC transport system permease protein